MSSDESEKKLLESLIIDKKSILERLVNQAQGVVGIEKESGEAVILAPKSKLTDREQLFLLLLGRFFASKLGRSDSESLSTGDLSKMSGIDAKTVSRRLSELKADGCAESTIKGEYRLLYANAESILAGIKSKLGGSE